MTTFKRVLGGMLLLATLIVPAMSADDEMARKAINDPVASWGIWGPAKIDFSTDPALPGRYFRRVAVSPKPAQAWDIGAYVLISKPVKKGDVLLLAFWARATTPPAGSDFLELSARIYEVEPPKADITPETQFFVGREWKLYYASGVAKKDYPAGTLGCGMLLGANEQTVDLGPAYIVDYGPDYDMSTLPSN